MGLGDPGKEMRAGSGPATRRGVGILEQKLLIHHYKAIALDSENMWLHPQAPAK